MGNDIESKYDSGPGSAGSGGPGGYMTCPMCDAELPVTDEEVRAGLYCSACGTPLKLMADDKRKQYLEEDF
jgi:hypothetical protein